MQNLSALLSLLLICRFLYDNSSYDGSISFPNLKQSIELNCISFLAELFFFKISYLI
jgi:hypothetical protein